MNRLRPYVWWTVATAGIAFVAAGVYTVDTGLDARQDALNELREENITLSQDDEDAAEEQVDTAAEARQQAEQIEKHTLERTDGLRYAELDREDPRREAWVTATTLRTALFSAAAALEITRLVVGLGIFLIAVGVGLAAVGAPVVYRVTR